MCILVKKIDDDKKIIYMIVLNYWKYPGPTNKIGSKLITV